MLSDVLELEHEASAGSFLGTLDLSKAFDHLRPATAVAVLQHAGFPKALAKGLGTLWGQQQRVITWQGLSSDRPQRAGTSLPQGDAFSVLALSLVISLPERRLRNTNCELQVTYEFTILGVTFRGTPNRTMSKKERKRMDAANRVADRSQALPVPLRKKAFLTTLTSAAVSAWGWLQWAPPKYALNRLEVKWRAWGLLLGRPPVA